MIKLINKLAFYRQCILALLAITTLSACQSVRPPFTDGEQQARFLARQVRWQAEGKIALSYDGERQNASFHWKQNKQTYQIHLFGPFGQGSTWIKSDGKQVTLETPKLGKQSASSAEDLMQENLGWQVPVSNLGYWVRGLMAPAPPVESVKHDLQGFMEQLDQQNWHVVYQRYGNHKGWWLPQKIIATRANMRMILVVKEWHLSAAPKH